MTRNLLNLGWNESLQQAFDSLGEASLKPARIARENRGEYIAFNEFGELRIRLPGSYLACKTRHQWYPITGDWVAVEGEIIRKILPRRGVFEREAAGNQSKVQKIAAHIDYAFLVAGLDHDFNPKRIERYLSLASSSSISPVVVLNKADLCPNIEEQLAQLDSVAKTAPIHLVSALTQEGLDALSAYFQTGVTIALLGSSGAGKSTLINAFIGNDQLKTGAVRESDSRGRHTTTWREMVLMPQGSVILDTPGMREIQLLGDDDGIKKAFSDIDELAKQCRFRNCTHTNEPGCAIIKAVEKGTLDNERFHSYLKQKAENRHKRNRKRIVDTDMASALKKRKRKLLKSISVSKRKAEKQRRKLSRSVDGDFGYK